MSSAGSIMSFVGKIYILLARIHTFGEKKYTLSTVIWISPRSTSTTTDVPKYVHIGSSSFNELSKETRRLHPSRFRYVFPRPCGVLLYLRRKIKGSGFQTGKFREEVYSTIAIYLFFFFEREGGWYIFSFMRRWYR